MLIWLSALLLAITCVSSVQICHTSPFQTSMFQDLSNDINNFLIQWVLTLASALWKFGSPPRLQLPKWELLGSVRVHSLTLFWTFGNMRCDSQASLLTHTLASPSPDCEPKVKVATTSVQIQWLNPIWREGLQFWYNRKQFLSLLPLHQVVLLQRKI
jgi:hypothetical protein